MRPNELEKYLQFAISTKEPVLITASPGVGKSDITEAATKAAGADLIITHPVVSDPTDYKGLPYAENGQAHFLPFGDLNKIIVADKPTVYFIDDLGQAPAAVQASIMQLVLARKINGHKVSDQVTFIAATNRRQDKAGVSGLLNPVKSRFTIIPLEVDVDDWCRWAIGVGGMPIELISFIRFRPALLNDPDPSKDILNTASPRTVSSIGRQQNNGLPASLRMSVFTGAAGESFAAEYVSFLEMYTQLPDVNQIFLNPTLTPIPTRPDILFALSGAIAARMTPANAGSAFEYLKRLSPEIGVACAKDACARNPQIAATRDFMLWASSNGNLVFN